MPGVSEIDLLHFVKCDQFLISSWLNITVLGN